MAKHLLPADKELVIGGGMMDRHLEVSINNGQCHKVPALVSDYEEVILIRVCMAEEPPRGSYAIKYVCMYVCVRACVRA